MTLYILGFVLTFFFTSLALQLTHELGTDPDFNWVESEHHTAKLVIVLLFCLIWPAFVFWAVLTALWNVLVRKRTPRWLRIWMIE